MKYNGKITATMSAAAVLVMFVIPTMASASVQYELLTDNDPIIIKGDMLPFARSGYGEQNHENESSNE